MEKDIKKVLLEDLKDIIGFDTPFESSQFSKLVDEDLLYSDLTNTEANLLSILKRIDSGELKKASQDRFNDWSDGWNENLIEYKETGQQESLIPKYFRDFGICRFQDKYIRAESPVFVYRVINILRTYIFSKYFKDVSKIYEIGCGTGHHLLRLSELFPNKSLCGLDWTETSSQIIQEINKNNSTNIEYGIFDFNSPDYSLDVPDGSAILTFGALEQIGHNHDKYFSWIFDKNPEIIVNIEGFNELYDQNIMSHYLAHKYHKIRGYLDGYLNYIEKLEEKGLVTIIDKYHVKFGNQYDDSSSYVVWRINK